MPRYDGAETLLALVLALQAPGRGISIPDVQERFGVSRRTAERLRSAAERLFPDLWWETGPDGRRYWKLRRGAANGLIRWSLDELVALEWALREARRSDAARHAAALEGIVEKVRALLQPEQRFERSRSPRERPATERGLREVESGLRPRRSGHG